VATEFENIKTSIDGIPEKKAFALTALMGVTAIAAPVVAATAGTAGAISSVVGAMTGTGGGGGQTITLQLSGPETEAFLSGRVVKTFKDKMNKG